MATTAPRSNLRLASFDGGGIRCFSQLLTMRRLMHTLKFKMYPNERNRVILPCECFDMIGGSDAGGLIMIMLVKLRMTVEEAIENFGLICEEVYLKKLTAEERTRTLRTHLEEIVIGKGHSVNLPLADEDQREGCLGFVVTTPGAHATNKTCLRTYCAPGDQPYATVIDAALATCASRPEFLPVTLGPTRFEQADHIGAGLGANNPTRRVLAEATSLFGAESSVSLLLSLGSGHPGVLALTRSNKDDGLHKLMRAMLEDSEQEAEDVRQQMTQFPIYSRFSVVQGMQKGLDHRAFKELPWIAAQTTAYLDSIDTKRAVDNFATAVAADMRPTQAIPRPRTQAFLLRDLGGQSPVRSSAHPNTNPPRYQSIDNNASHVTERRPNDPLVPSYIQHQEPEGEPRRSNSTDGITSNQRDENIEKLRFMNDSALNYQEQERYQDAEPLQVRVVEGCKALFGEEHLETLDAMQSLAWTYYKQARYLEAESLQTKVLSGRETRLGGSSVKTLQAMEDLASNYTAQHRWSDSEPLQIRIFHAYEALEGASSAIVGTSAHHLAWTYYQLGRVAEANEFAMKAGVIWANLLKDGVEDPCAKYTMLLLQRLNQPSDLTPSNPVEPTSTPVVPAPFPMTPPSQPPSPTAGNQCPPTTRPVPPLARAGTNPASWVKSFLPNFFLW